MGRAEARCGDLLRGVHLGRHPAASVIPRDCARTRRRREVKLEHPEPVEEAWRRRWRARPSAPASASPAPDKVVYPAPGPHQDRPDRLLRSGRRADAAACRRTGRSASCAARRGTAASASSRSTTRAAFPRRCSHVMIAESSGDGRAVFLRDGPRRPRRRRADGGAGVPHLGLARRRGREARPHRLRPRSGCRPRLRGRARAPPSTCATGSPRSA